MEQCNSDRASLGSDWHLACLSTDCEASVQQFLEITDLLLERVNLNSTHLFRADILTDTVGKLTTLSQKTNSVNHNCRPSTDCPFAPDVPQNFRHKRTVVRRLIPRNPQLDRPLEQTCLFYSGPGGEQESSKLVLYVPHCTEVGDMPWYHPQIRALAYLYNHNGASPATLSVHYIDFKASPTTLSNRLQRTMSSLLGTYVRLLRHPARHSDASSSDHPLVPQSDDRPVQKRPISILELPLTPANLRDTILPQHLVQDKYTQLKTRYAKNLMENWVEKTEPSKHVFEDLGIAAFLIELWKNMYDISENMSDQEMKDKFPGFVDIACGNGVLTYILLSEGWYGYGFDARRRQTWDILHQLNHTLHLDQRLTEEVCIPQPFLDVLSAEDLDGLNFNSGVPPPHTFIISNHADELTCWTPLLARMSQSPFLAIPCCSHALDGSRKRYSHKDITLSQLDRNPQFDSHNSEATTADKVELDEIVNESEDQQPATGDLRALRARKAKGPSDEKSQYACLTRKTASLALELGFSHFLQSSQPRDGDGKDNGSSNTRSQLGTGDVELTLLRIPSTRNIGIVGGRQTAIRTQPRARRTSYNPSASHSHSASISTHDLDQNSDSDNDKPACSLIPLVSNDESPTNAEIASIVHRECSSTGGLQASAQTWLDKARKLQNGQGRGKVNWRGRRGETRE